MNWEEHKKNVKLAFDYGVVLERTNIECPKCGELIYKDFSVVYTSIPPKYRYTCLKCGWQEIDF